MSTWPLFQVMFVFGVTVKHKTYVVSCITFQVSLVSISLQHCQSCLSPVTLKERQAQVSQIPNMLVRHHQSLMMYWMMFHQLLKGMTITSIHNIIFTSLAITLGIHISSRVFCATSTRKSCGFTKKKAERECDR